LPICICLYWARIFLYLLPCSDRSICANSALRANFPYYTRGSIPCQP
jgi:hypothetical protein